MKLRPLALFVIGTLAGALTVYDSRFFQAYLSPKLMLLYLAGAGAVALLACERELRLPEPKVLGFFLAFLGIVGLRVSVSATPWTELAQASYLFAGILIFVAVLNFTEQEQRLLLSMVFAVAVTEAAKALLQASRSTEVIGTVGNSEFLAALLGFALLALPVLLPRKHLVWPARLLLLAAIVATRNKGTIVFLAIWFLWHRRALLFASVPVVLSLFVLFPDSVKGRMLLWMATLSLSVRHSLFGVGLNRISSHYLDAFGDVFKTFPALVKPFGAHVGMALDGHNLFLHYFAELGIAGLVLSVLLFAWTFSLIRANRGGPWAAALGLLLFKSLYTVMLNSVSGLILFSVLAALMAPSRMTFAPSRAFAPIGAAVAYLFLLSSVLVSADVVYRRAMKFSLLQRRDLATEAFHDALERDPEHGPSWLGLAYQRFVEEERPRMDYTIRQALFHRSDMDSIKTSAHMYFFRGMDAEARPLYETIHAAFPEHLTSLSRLAQIALRSGEVARAGELSRRVLEIYPRVASDSDERNRRVAKQIFATALRVRSESSQ